jgi:glycosyltransferase involved in cell wall biosynthesis
MRGGWDHWRWTSCRAIGARAGTWQRRGEGRSKASGCGCDEVYSGRRERFRLSRRIRILVVGTHPVQYASPIFRLLAQDSKIESQVAYCSLQGVEAQIDPDFGVEVKWDIPLLEGYPWVLIPNRSWAPRVGSFFGLLNLGIWRMIRRGNFDAVILFTGYICATFWIALAAAKWKGSRVLFSSDAHTLTPRDRKSWKLWVKRCLWPLLFRLSDVVIVPSSGGVHLMRFLGVPEARIGLVPYSVNNEWWIEKSEQTDRAAVRARWGVPEDAAVILFCAKLQAWKRPSDLLRAFARVAQPGTYLVFAGEGALRPSLVSEAESLGIASRTRFLGFVNQSGLPDTYTASDILVLPSEYEPFGVVVNEAMLCGCPVIVSDCVGARFDLVRDDETGFVFPAGDVEALASILRGILPKRERLHEMGKAARQQMASCSPIVAVEKTIEAVRRALKT